MTVRISRSLLKQILDHAASNEAEEVCGLLFGTDDLIEAARPALNVAADRRTRFELDPVVLLKAHRAQRMGGPRVIGHYHSHPTGYAYPSQYDAGAAERGLWLILSGNEAGLFEAWAGGPIHGAFQPRTLKVT